MRFYVGLVVLALVGCVGGNGTQRDMGPGSYENQDPEIVRPPKEEKPPRRPQPDEPPRDDCVAHQTACMQSRLSKERGSVYGSNRCRACKEKCEAVGIWPWFTHDGKRCDWWSYPPRRGRVAAGSSSR